jgi:2-C-methyl-D-erythritol 4-phosphate cytidylyltransferase
LAAAAPKAFVDLAGKPLARWALDNVLACGHVGHVVLVAPAEHLSAARALVAESERDVVDVVVGGRDRRQSVAHGMALLRPDDGVVLVHDAARCLAPPELFDAVIHAVRGGHGAVVPGLPVLDTVKQVGVDGHVVATPDRAGLRAVQTPQGFLREVLEHAHALAAQAATRGEPVDVTDDAGLVEATGAPVLVIQGHLRAMKVTTAQDLATMRSWLAESGGAEPSPDPA